MLVTKFSIDKSKRCTTAWLNLRPFLSMQFFTYKVMSQNSGLTHAKDCDACSLWKDVPLHNFVTYTDVFAWKCSHRNTCLHTTCHIISYVVLNRQVSTQCVFYETYSCACSHTKRLVSVHFLTYEVMPMRNFKHITPCLSRPTGAVETKYNITTFLAYELFSLCNFWLTRTSPCANCHIWGRVCLKRVTKFLTFYLDHHVSTHCVDYVTCLCACSRTKKTYVCTLFELERHVHA